jgi:hypothetical protein
MPLQGIVVAQLIATAWTKRSRGAPMATLRNRVPERLALPERTAVTPPACVVLMVDYGEQNRFASPTHEQFDVFDDIKTPLTPAVGLYLKDGELVVVLEGPYAPDNPMPAVFETSGMGAPRRQVPRSAFSLMPGEWGQVRYMGRWSGWHGAWYEKWVCNIGWFEKLSRGVFQDTTPHHRYESMPEVW